MLVEGIVLGHNISSKGIRVDPTKKSYIKLENYTKSKIFMNVPRACKLLLMLY